MPWKICVVKGLKKQEAHVKDELLIFLDMTPCLVEWCKFFG
jgi:hypothetical protein